MKRILLILCFAIGMKISSAAEHEGLPGPLFDGLGKLHCPVTTTSTLAQRYFDQGLTLCYAFNHAEAVRSFQAAAELDPACAMAYWGIAYAYGPHVNKPMTPEDTAAAWAALQQAQAHKPAASRKEQDWIDALSKRYQAQHHQNRTALDQAYAQAMRELVKRYPDDLESQTLLAEALMDTMPWDYWLKDRSPKPETEEALAALQFVLSRDRNHPGANHFLIHALEAGPHPEQGLAAADRLLNFAPEAGHLVHMPSHIYMRVGEYEEAVLANERAVLADRQYVSHCRAQGFYPAVYYPHNLHFLWWALVFEGRAGEALEIAKRAVQYAADNSCGPNKVVTAPRLRHLPWLTLLRFGRWDDLLKTSPPPASTNDFLVDRALWHFSRGVALAARGGAEGAAREYAEFHRIAQSEDARKLDDPRFPVTSILKIADEWLAGKAAGARGDQRALIEHLEKAVAAEDALPYMEPAYWPFPVRPVLAAALLQAGDAIRAEQVFREDLQRMPRDPWALFGLERSLRAQGRTDGADTLHRQFEAMWHRADTPLDLALF